MKVQVVVDVVEVGPKNPKRAPRWPEICSLSLGFRVRGLGFRVQGSGFRVWVQGSGFRVWGLGFGFGV